MNKTLAWGSLTGIRPTKLAYELKKEGQESTLEAFEQIFKVPHKKAKLVDDILKNQKSRMHLVVTFLAILEMMKMGTITVEQENTFDDIIITSNV